MKVFGIHVGATVIVGLILLDCALLNATASSSASTISPQPVPNSRKAVSVKTAETTPVSSWRTLYDEGEADLADQKPGLAERHFRKALKLAAKQSSEQDEVEKCILKLADTLNLRDQTSEAQHLFQGVLNARTKRYGSNSSQLAPVLFALGSIEESEGNHTLAMNYYDRALKINERNYGPYSPAVTNNLGKSGHDSFGAQGGKQTAKLPNKHYDGKISALLKEPGLTSSSQLKSFVQEHSDLLSETDNSNKDLINYFNSEIMHKSQTVSSDTFEDTESVGKLGS